MSTKNLLDSGNEELSQLKAQSMVDDAITEAPSIKDVPIKEDIPLDDSALNIANKSPAEEILESAKDSPNEFSDNKGDIIKSKAELPLDTNFDNDELEIQTPEASDFGAALFDGHTEEAINKRIHIKEAEGSGNSSITVDTMDKTSGLRGGSDEDDKKKKFHERMAIEIAIDSAQEFAQATQLALEIASNALGELRAEQQGLELQIAEADAQIAEFDTKITEQTTVVAAAEIDVSDARLNVQVAEERLEGAEEGFQEQATELADAENKSGFVIDRGQYTMDEGFVDPPIIYFQDEQGFWSKGTVDENGDTSFTSISNEEAAKFQSNDMTTDMYYRAVTIEEPDGTKVLAVQNGMFTEAITEVELKMIQKFSDIQDIDPTSLGANTNEINSALNKMSGSWSTPEEAQEDLNDAQNALDTSVATLNTEQERLQGLILHKDTTVEMRAGYASQIAENANTIKQIEEFEQKAQNGEFENEQQMFDAMPDYLKEEYLERRDEPEAEVAQEPVRATTDRTASYSGAEDGAQSTVETYNVASGIAPAPITPDHTQDPALDPNKNDQSFPSNDGMGVMRA